MTKATLKDLFKIHGRPEALIDNHKTKLGYAIYSHSDEVTGYQHTDNILNKLSCTIKKWQQESKGISAVGYISYDIKNIIYPHINFKPTNNQEPIFRFIKPEKTISYNICDENSADLSEESFSLIQDIMNHKEYVEIIEKIKIELELGNAYQINMTMLKKYKINIHPFNLYLIIRKLAKPHFGYYLNIENEYVLSFSPEQFFDIKDGIIKTYPMKGTRPRGITDFEDQQFKTVLSKSEKDRAEHLMIVDLMRNDIGKICKYGSVKVENLFKVYSYATVHQMVSCVSGKLKKTVSLSDIIRALFPGGSITGAPKESAMKIIDKLENYSRGIYTGGIGYFQNNGNINFNMAIRTMIIKNMVGKYSVGGGIVWDSEPMSEWEEAQLKSEILKL